MEIKEIISIAVVVMTIVAYIPYIKDTFSGKTKPHIFTWITGTITASTIFGLQLFGGGGVGSFPTLSVALICLLITLLSIQRGTKDIKSGDYFFLLFSIVGVIVWVFLDQPVFAIIILTISQVSGYIPTIRKSWLDPESETLSLYTISTIRHGISILALNNLNILTILWPITWAAVNLLIAIMLIYRRK